MAAYTRVLLGAQNQSSAVEVCLLSANGGSTSYFWCSGTRGSYLISTGGGEGVRETQFGIKNSAKPNQKKVRL